MLPACGTGQPMGRKKNNEALLTFRRAISLSLELVIIR